MQTIQAKDIEGTTLQIGDTVLYARKSNYSANGTLVKEKITNIYEDNDMPIVTMGKYKSTSPETQLYKLNQ